jgi:ribosomal protein S18 acetylase RimI-like enzyme
MITIAKLQQRDLETLTLLHPERDFEAYYLEHLQEFRHVLVASRKDTDSERSYLGYVSVLWESEYTPFWRHNISEIVELYVAENQCGQGIEAELIKAIEASAEKKGFKKIGVRLARVGEFAIAQKLYQSLGYREDGFERKAEEDLCLMKALL